MFVYAEHLTWSRVWEAMSLPHYAASGLLALGCNSIGHIDTRESRKLVAAALDLGVTHFDTAAAYADGNSELELGRFLPHDRDKLFLATKVGHPASVPVGEGALSPTRICSAVDDSLRRLRVDTLDLCYLHFPDELTPLDDVLATTGALITEGKLAAYGVSNFNVGALRAVLDSADRLRVPRPVAVQAEYSLLNRAAEKELIPFALQEGLSFFPFFPLASGMLTGRYTAATNLTPTLRTRIVRNFHDRFVTPANQLRLRRMQALCDEAGVPLITAALQWIASRPGVSIPLVGASNAEQLSANVSALRRSALPHLLSSLTRLEL